jgi:phage FluMu protein Com
LGLPDVFAIAAGVVVVSIVLIVFLILLTSSKDDTFFPASRSEYPTLQARSRELGQDVERRARIILPSFGRCEHCGAPMKPTDEYCLSCGAPTKAQLITSSASERVEAGGVRSGGCIVCRRILRETDETLSCPHCRGLAHRDDMLEWLHIKGSCPACGRRLNEAQIKEQVQTHTVPRYKWH